jgi:NAD(P)-dependent dehydrogenase (short-subunit alcohol dehydrogenase family)
MQAKAILLAAARMAAGLLDRHQPACCAIETARHLELDASRILVGDQTDIEWSQTVAEEGQSMMGGLGCLVSSAGTFEHAAVLETSLDTWRRVLDINLTAGFTLARDAARLMPDKSSIVFASSQIGIIWPSTRGRLCSM